MSFPAGRPVRSLVWAGDRLVDPIAGAVSVGLDGATRPSSVSWAYEFDPGTGQPGRWGHRSVHGPGHQGSGYCGKPVQREVNRGYHDHVDEYTITGTTPSRVAGASRPTDVARNALDGRLWQASASAPGAEVPDTHVTAFQRGIHGVHADLVHLAGPRPATGHRRGGVARPLRPRTGQRVVGFRGPSFLVRFRMCSLPACG